MAWVMTLGGPPLLLETCPGVIYRRGPFKDTLTVRGLFICHTEVSVLHCSQAME